MYDKLVTKINKIDTRKFVLKTKYQTDKLELEKKILILVSLLKKTNCNNKIIEIENKIPNISGLARNTALTAVENKIRDVINWVKKQTITQTVLKLEINLLIIIMTNILLPQSLTS